MRFDLSEDQKLLRDATRDFLSAESPIEVSRRVSEAEGEGFSAAQWDKLAELGYLGLLSSETVGGQGLGPIELAVVCEEMGRVCYPGPYLDVVLAAELLARAGEQGALTEVVRGASIVVLATDDRVWSNESARTEFNSGRVNGKKFFVPFASAARYLVATTDRGLAFVEGPFDVEAMPTLDESRRYGAVSLDNPARLIADNELLESVWQLGAIGSAAMALGVAEETLESSVQYSRERETFGRPIGSYQALQHRMADMLVRSEASRALVYKAAWACSTAQGDAALIAASAKSYASRAANLNSRECLQIHGGNGFTWEYNVHRYLKLAMTLEHYYGSREVMTDRALAELGCT
ncbi:MAG: acyl-CoA dehydrogenase family protein [Candidatus Binatia bacterium]